MSTESGTAYNITSLFEEAIALYNEKRFEEAIGICKIILDNDPRNAEACNIIGICCKSHDKFTEAIEWQEKAVSIAPENTDYLKNLELTCRQNGNFVKALEAINKAIKLSPGNKIFHHSAALSLNNLGKIEDAFDELKKALNIDPDFLEAHIMAANLYKEIGNTEKTREHFANAEKIAPNNTFLQYNHSLFLLSLGDFEKGLKDYETRWLQGPPMTLPSFFKGKQMWDGKPFADKSLLVFAEQGLGDTIMFSRYIPHITKLGKDISILCPKSLIDLLKPLAPDAAWYPLGSAVPVFDIFVPLMSMPLLAGTTIENIPSNVPYISASEEYKHKWQNKFSGNNTKKIGLCWFGSHHPPKSRSIPAQQIEKIFANKNLDFYLLQKDYDTEIALDYARKYKNVFSLGQDIEIFSDTAAIIDQLDLVVTVDTSVAHLAGGMGKDVWVLLKYSPDWRWFMGRNDSPWYPSAKLLRQQKRGDWSGVLEQIKKNFLNLEN